MNDLIAKLVVPHDKANHFLWGVIICALVGLPLGPLWGIGIVAAAAVARELTNPTGFSPADIAWTLAGGAAVAAPMRWSALLIA